MSGKKKSVFIAGASSDIGGALTQRYAAAGWQVSGTYRKESALPVPSGAKFFPCDINSAADILQVTTRFQAEVGFWDLYISSVGVLDPIGSFFDCSFASWKQSITTNSLQQLALLHALFPFKRSLGTSDVCFFAGAGTNGPAPNYSAYAAAKILLIKMCELLHAEEDDINVFIIGPGMVRTKIHQQTLQAGVRAGNNLKKVKIFLSDQEAGITHDQVFACLQWCVQAGRDVVGGRNISLAGDNWSTSGVDLANKLRNHPDAFRLRRSHNDL